MKIHVFPEVALAIKAAADSLGQCLTQPGTRSLMVAGGNSPLALYEEIARRSLDLAHLKVFCLDEYAGVPPADPRTCANLIRQTVMEPWGIPTKQFFSVSSLAAEALASIQEHERRLAEQGGLDVLILGLGKNGHLGFNEPGSAPDSIGRIMDLTTVSVEANRAWFGGDYAPSKGVTVGLQTILSARRILLLAFGETKAEAVKNMVEGPRTNSCPASWLQGHADVQVFLDQAAAAQLRGSRSMQGRPIQRRDAEDAEKKVETRNPKSE